MSQNRKSSIRLAVIVGVVSLVIIAGGIVKLM
jgi:hypothetical protein